MSTKDIFQQNAIDFIMQDTFAREIGVINPVYRPVRHSPYVDCMHLLQDGKMAGKTIRNRVWATESGYVTTRQGTIVVWGQYRTLHTWGKSHLYIALKLYLANQLFEYVNHNLPVGLEQILHILNRHYIRN